MEEQTDRKERKHMNKSTNGEIKINDEFVLFKGLTAEEFKNSKVFKTFVEQTASDYTRYYAKDNFIDNDKAAISLYFNSNNVLETINIILLENGTKAAWDNWTQENKMKTKDRNSEWVRARFGNPPYEFPWGSVWLKDDPRTGESSVDVVYKY